MKTLLNDALNYAAKGWFVVPDHGINDRGGCTCADAACKVEGKHPRMERDSIEGRFRGIGSIDPFQISQWWAKWPDSNIAIVCGMRSGLVVVDIDPRNDGFNSWNRLVASKHGGPIVTLTALSGGGGEHLYFAHPKTQEIRNRIGLLPGIDIKADGGRIVAAPSRHKSGRCYGWKNLNAPIASIPPWLFYMIQIQKGTGTWQAMRKTGRR